MCGDARHSCPGDLGDLNHSLGRLKTTASPWWTHEKIVALSVWEAATVEHLTRQVSQEDRINVISQRV